MKGRIRTIKPQAHLDEDLWDVEERSGLPLFRLFVGLWNYADREGRFVWRPRRLKAVILPYWGGDIFAALEALVGARFLVRYEVDGRQYGAVRTFHKHQVINNREDPSTLPPPPDQPLSDPPEPENLTSPDSEHDSGQNDACPTRDPRVPDACARVVDLGKGKKVEGKGREGNGNGTGLHASLDAGARVYARDGCEVSAAQIRTRFQKLFQERFQALPYLGGGEVVTSFADRLRGTADERGLDALELLEATFAAWASKPLDEIAQNAPYAAFAARFGSLCKPKGANGASELDELHAAQIAALQSGDRDRYRSLLAEEKRRTGRSE